MKSLQNALIEKIMKNGNVDYSMAINVLTKAMEAGGEAYANAWHKPAGHYISVQKAFDMLVKKFMPEVETPANDRSEKVYLQNLSNEIIHQLRYIMGRGELFWKGALKRVSKEIKKQFAELVFPFPTENIRVEYEEDEISGNSKIVIVADRIEA